MVAQLNCTVTNRSTIVCVPLFIEIFCAGVAGVVFLYTPYDNAGKNHLGYLSRTSMIVRQDQSIKIILYPQSTNSLPTLPLDYCNLQFAIFNCFTQK